MRRVRGNLCRNKKGRFTKCRGRASSSGGRRKGRRKGRSCKYGVSKTTGRCLKHPRKKR